MAKIKIIDVAQHAGVSKSTVSQYLNNRFDYMSKETQARIAASIAELNYIPNPIARSLKSAKTKTIGVIVRDITGFDTSRTLRGIDDFCKNSDYNVIIYNTDFDPETEARSLQALRNLRVDGIIISSSGKNNELINQLNQDDFPIVQFQLEYDDCDTDIVISDYKQAAYDATEYLIKQGHKNICFMTQTFSDVKSRNDRYLGYVEAHKDYGLPTHDNLIQFWDREVGFEQALTKTLNMNPAPTAIFSQHLAITTNLLTHLNRLEVRIPQDISLIGFDEIPMAEFLKVPVTVVQQKPYRIGELAAQKLLKAIQNPSKDRVSERTSVHCTIAERASCRPI